MDSFFTVSRVALCICLLALAAAPEHTENKMDVFPGVVGSIFLLAVFALAFQPGFSGALPATAAIRALRPVSAPVERPPGLQLYLLPRRDIVHRARPFRARGAVCRGRASPIPLPAEMLFASPLQAPFRGVFHLVFPHDSATKRSR